MNEVSLPPGMPEADIAHVRRLTLYIKAGGEPDQPVTQLTYNILSEDADDNGFEIPENETAEDVIEKFLDTGSPFVGLAPGPLDFAIAKKCHIVLRLAGNFWEFDLKGGVTTKLELNGRYYRLIPHSRKGRVVAVSFCAMTPDLDKSNPADRTRHAINLHIDFLDYSGPGGALRRLLVIIDPDVENRGG